MKEIGIVICNYNKSSYVLKCIETVLASEFTDFDVFVVDNASTDDSVASIKKRYGDQVTVLQNTENLGGSGGFNTGIRKVLAEGYPYLCCLDNDVQVTPKAIGALHDFLTTNPHVGMVGSKVHHLQAPEYIQQMGLNIHFDTFSAETLYADVLDEGQIPEVVYCDTVAACSLMMPTKVAREVGTMPEDTFIYWDDMEWGYLVKQAGYEVAAISSSKVFHEMSANVRRENTFSTYYLWRNNLYFFMKYTPKEKWDTMSFVLLRAVFDAIYQSLYQDEHNVATTLQYAFFDAMMGVRGKAADGKILINDGNARKVEKALNGLKRVYVDDVCCLGLQEGLKQLKPDLKFVGLEDAEKKFRSCKFIMDVEDTSLEYIYVDADWNMLCDKDDVEMVKNYSFSLQLFIYMHQNAFLSQTRKIQENLQR